METELPTPEDAASALREVERARGALKATVPPWWYFVTTAAMVAIVPTASYLPKSTAGLVVGLVAFAGWTALLVFMVRRYQRTIGFTPRLRSSKLQLVASGVLSGAVLSLAMHAADWYHLPWLGYLGSGMVAAGILVVGALSRRSARRHRNRGLRAA